ncbi:MAG: hypothetical protein CNIPEHKO_00699 [Anaerolineales bacterium]|nr:hypothetical protein [Anaerolineae bacterium]MBV6400413.1 hypothetical protein [Anaerolineales bacterium]MCC7190454.1 hypothetical protein [Anaerolineales bacterium]HQU37030.1 hypothetical protein [Anaerolineales bacterium]
MKKVLLTIVLTGILAACGGQPTDAPASPPTSQPAPATEALSPTDTSAPPTDTAIPTVIIPTTPPTEAENQTATVSFSNEILPILDSRCKNCHGGRETKEGLNLTTYAALMAGSENGLILTPGDADNSLLAEQVITQEMPKRGPKLTPPQVQLIVDWINQGALDN